MNNRVKLTLWGQLINVSRAAFPRWHLLGWPHALIAAFRCGQSKPAQPAAATLAITGCAREQSYHGTAADLGTVFHVAGEVVPCMDRFVCINGFAAATLKQRVVPACSSN
jgi:hypothetical protein